MHKDNLNRIRHGDELVTLELTVKEAMALEGGARFWWQPELAANARRKIRNQLERKLIHNERKLDLHEIGL